MREATKCQKKRGNMKDYALNRNQSRREESFVSEPLRTTYSIRIFRIDNGDVTADDDGDNDDDDDG